MSGAYGRRNSISFWPALSAVTEFFVLLRGELLEARHPPQDVGRVVVRAGVVDEQAQALEGRAHRLQQAREVAQVRLEALRQRLRDVGELVQVDERAAQVDERRRCPPGGPRGTPPARGRRTRSRRRSRARTCCRWRPARRGRRGAAAIALVARAPCTTRSVKVFWSRPSSCITRVKLPSDGPRYLKVSLQVARSGRRTSRRIPGGSPAVPCGSSGRAC